MVELSFQLSNQKNDLQTKDMEFYNNKSFKHSHFHLFLFTAHLLLIFLLVVNRKCAQDSFLAKLKVSITNAYLCVS